ncbi:Hypothetical protein, putative [Bodo saltans]|uniref:Uncharacterized protein n=1 Tax=Bodo saltans TaxID=75058 RepID=A0A0S4IV29_BODSA|nr:Hypothetical protein, putative [Bodo saltans]|eukprot:CUG15366.1 Hypothetical protein, putative [Bodo saltans]
MVRRKFHLAQESMLVSAAKGFFCAPCSVGQVYREMSLRHMWPADGGLCVDAPYTKAGLVVPPPNPNRMGGTWASSRTTTTTTSGNNDQEMRSAPQSQWQQHSSHQGREEQSAFSPSSREGDAIVVGQPIAYGYPTQQPTAPPPAPTTTDQRFHQQHYPTKPVYGYGDGPQQQQEGQQHQATAPPTASHTASRPSLAAPAERFEELQLPSHHTLLLH